MPGKKYEIDMCNGKLAGKMLAFALPLMLSGFLQLLFNAVDIIVLGKFVSNNALAAVGSTGSMIVLLTSLFMGLSVGTNILTARYYGAGNAETIHKVVHTSVALGVICGVIMAAAGIIAAPALLLKMGIPDELLDMAVLYMRIYFLGMPVSLIYNLGSAVLRAVGDTKRPLYFLLTAGVLNVGMNLFFILILHMEISGVAMATVLSQTVAMILLLRVLCTSDTWIHLNLRKVRFYKKETLQILQIGLPASLQGMIFALSGVLIQSSINSFGADAMAGSAAAANIEGFVTTSMNAFHQTAMNFTSQNYGAGKYKRIKKVMLWSLVYNLIAGGCVGNFVYLTGNKILSIYLNDPVTISYGMVRLKYTCILYFLLGTMDIFVGVLRGLGYIIQPMLISLTGVCGLRIVWIYTIFQRIHTLDILYLSYPVTWAVAALAQMICTWIVWKKIKTRNNLGDS